MLKQSPVLILLLLDPRRPGETAKAQRRTVTPGLPAFNPPHSCFYARATNQGHPLT